MTKIEAIQNLHNELIIGDQISLPNLSPVEHETAIDEDNLDWLVGLMNFYNRGDVHHMDSSGVILQIVSKQVLRCLRVYDHPEPLKVLALIQSTCEAGGVRLVLDGTLLSPYTPPSIPTSEVGISDNDIGMEVA